MSSGARWPKSGALRLPTYDYASAGAYFVTICTHQRLCLFDSPGLQEIAEEAWQEIPLHFANVQLDAFVVMPNHVHGVLHFTASEEEPVAPQHAGALQKRPTLSVVVRSFKAAVTRDLRLRRLHDGQPFWQANFYDRIIRNDAELNRIREYIAQNPVAWSHDHENPLRVADDAYDRVWSWLERS